MSNLKALALAGAIAAFSFPGAQAADLPPLMHKGPPPMVEEVGGGWYLRGDIGAGVGNFTNLDHFPTAAGFVWPASWTINNQSIDSSFFIGAGVGYQFNNWLRFDVTGEYRSSAKFKAIGSYSEFCPVATCFDVYDGSVSSTVFLANAYIDLGTWWRITPFIGAGIGGGYHVVSNISDYNPTTGGFGYAADRGQWNMAWAVHAGLAYDVNSSFKVELAYRYLNMGTVFSDVLTCGACGVVGPAAYYGLRDYDSHDFKLGMRWMFHEAPMPAYAPPPLIRKG